MAGWPTNGVPILTLNTGAELFILDTEAPSGQNPQTASMSTQQLALMMSFYGNALDKTMVSGTRYYSSLQIGWPAVLTGISVLVGTTGGTDLWIAELHGPTGTLLATSTTSG